MTYKAALETIGRTKWRGSRLGLERIGFLTARLGNPQTKLRFIHVAGTNGKGSVCAFLHSVLNEAGLKTGLFTSPYVRSVNECIRINGEPISDEDFADTIQTVKDTIDGLLAEGREQPTEYEILTAAAFVYFAHNHCDIVVLETGMGGRLDATNIIDAPELAVITSISLDHTHVLGDTVEEIAREKSGIIKRGCDVILYEQEPEITTIFEQACAEKDAHLFPVLFSKIVPRRYGMDGQSFDFFNLKGLTIPLLGHFQIQNAATAVAALMRLQEKGVAISEKNLREGLAKTKWPGRFEPVYQSPTVIIDAAHNVSGVQAAAYNLRRYFPDQKITFVIGILKDKDYEAMLRLIIPLSKRFFAVTPKNARALDVKKLAIALRQAHGNVQACDSIEEGIREALKKTDKDGVICILGSLYMTEYARSFFSRTAK